MNESSASITGRWLWNYMLAQLILLVVLVAFATVQGIIIQTQSNTIKELTTVCERLSQVFEEAQEGTETAVEPEQQTPEGVTNL